MSFLCQTHREFYINKPDELISKQWFEWMLEAGHYYESSQWRKAVPFAGCAFDLASLRLRDHSETPGDAMTQLTLSAIYLSNIFEHMGLHIEAENIRQLALENLERISGAMKGENCEYSTCKRCLWNAAHDTEFVQGYLNVPFVLPEVSHLQMVFH